MMAQESILAAVKAVRNGTVARIGYRTQLPVKAAHKKEGISVYRFVESSLRLGVGYNNMASVKARRASSDYTPTTNRTNNYEWVIANKVSYNRNTDKEYIFAATFNQAKQNKVFYVVYMNSCPVVLTSEGFMGSEYSNFVIDSYWKSSGSSDVLTISFDNIFKVNRYGESIEEALIRTLN